MASLVKKVKCICCRRDFNILLELKAERTKLDVECPYCKKIGETTGTRVLKVEREN